MRYRLILAFLFILFASNSVLAQKSVFRKADQEYNRMRYKSAIHYYEAGLALDSLDILAVERLALSYKNIRDYENAEKWFARAIYLSPGNVNDYLHYAQALASNKKYAESASWYRKLAEKGVKTAAKFADTYEHHLQDLYIDSAQWKIRFTSLNTTFDEFSPVYFKKGLIFPSNRHFSVRNKLISGWDLKPFIDLYSIVDTSDIQHFDMMIVNKPEKKEIKPVPQIQDNRTVGDFGVRGLNGSGLYEFNARPTKAQRVKGDVRSKFHDGPVSLPADQRSMIFTRNNYYHGKERLSRDGVNRLKLYSAQLIHDKWAAVKEFDYNSNEYSTAHPALSPDGNTLYFSSDMPGGSGGMDLYYSIKQNGKWSRPVNLGPTVNTNGDEVFPFLRDGQELYFSSTGLPGLGGTDIFRVPIGTDRLPHDQPVNVGYPVNSSKDDFGIIFKPAENCGYFSSNRQGNDDIYSFRYDADKLSLKGFIVNTDKRTPVSNAVVLIKSGGAVDTIRADSAGHFGTYLKKDTDYQIYSVKNGISSERSTVSTYRKSVSEEINLTLIVDEPYKNSSLNAAAPSLTPNKINQVPENRSITELNVQQQIRKPSVSAEQILMEKKVTYVDDSQLKMDVKPTTIPAPVNIKDTTQRRHEADVIPASPVIKRVVVAMKPITNKAVSSRVRSLNCAELRQKFYIDNIYYPLNKSYIRNSELPVLARLIKLMKENPGIQVIANSHTDATASNEYNQELSRNRSMVVKRYLVSQGIAEDRITTEYSGKSHPLIPCLTDKCTPKELELNRRTEFYIILGGKNITLDCN